MESTESQSRQYTIKRSNTLGYGFVAGDDLPTIIKLVEPSGPSFNRLLPGDIILAVNGINVENASREQIVKMIQLCRDHIDIKVCQPTRTVPNITRIFFENGHSTVLSYDQDTTVRTLLERLASKPIINFPHSEKIKGLFGLALTVNEGSKKKRYLHILDENDSIIKLSKLPYAKELRLIYRMIDTPSDVNALYLEDKTAFEYLYQQSCNDLKLERFSPQLDDETIYKLSALHLMDYVHTNHANDICIASADYIKLVKKTVGLEYFLPHPLIDSKTIKRKKVSETLKKIVREFAQESNQTGRDTDYFKLMFLNYLSKLPCYTRFKRPTSHKKSDQRKRSDASVSSIVDYPIVDWVTEDRNYLTEDRNYLISIFDVIPPSPPPLTTRVLTDDEIKKLLVPPPPRG